MPDGIELAERLEIHPGLARSHFHFAELLQKKSDLPRAREKLDPATVLYRDMEMTWWLEQAEVLGTSLAVA